MIFAVDLKEYFYLLVYNICCVPPSGPLYPVTRAQWAIFRHENVIILKIVEGIETTN